MKKCVSLSSCLAVAGLLLTAIPPLALAEPADLRCLPVLIQIVESPTPAGPRAMHGTGFYFQSTNGFFLITAAHLFYRQAQPDVLVGSATASNG